MAAIEFTNEQSKVIHHDTCNLLVSAAAGSGKTAVLVQRIMELVLDGPKKTDIDRILVVTFTRNAAAQMKERIMQALEKRLEETPEDPHLLRQSVLIHQANITTIDSFCQSVVKNYFHKLDIDPAFRIGDETELELLWEQAVSEVLEEAHEAGEPEFLNLVDSYGGKDSDNGVAELITKLNEFADSEGWPEEWLRNATTYLRVGAEKSDAEFYVKAMEQAKSRLEGLLDTTRQMLEVCRETDGPANYAAAVADDESIIKLCLKQDTYQGMYEALADISYTSLKKNGKNVSTAKQNQVKGLRDLVKGTIGDVKSQLFFQPLEQMQEDMSIALQPMEILTELTIKTRERYEELLKKNNVLGFGEIEHLALRVLVEKDEDGNVHFTDVARNYSEQFDEIMIDEYQDSNLVQDLILRSVSKEGDGGANLFVVGDVKQSIYKFRMARPELFLYKYNTYEDDGDINCRIDLAKNFRSREKVLSSINMVFEKIMTKELGGIVYDEKAALYPGAKYVQDITKEQAITELILLDKDSEDIGDDAEETENITDTRLYVQAIIDRIRQLLLPDSGYMIQEGGKVRPINAGDIVILVRSLKGIAKPLLEEMLQQGIDACIATVEGYFTTTEVQTVLQLLRILDNPLQDIPMAAVLKSPIGGFMDEDLAGLHIIGRRAASKEYQPYLYETMRKIASGEAVGDDAIKRKCEEFLSVYDELYARKQILSVSELLEEIYRVTGYLMYCQAMPGGDVRKNHLEALCKKARDFRGFAYTELCDFVAYIDRMISYKVKVEDGSPVDSSRSVQIMTIHASKGLEFPVVILPDLQRNFNMRDASEAVVFHEKLGVGPTAYDVEGRTMIDTLAKTVIAGEIRRDSLGEELRILYTAMTRAKEKLILFGSVNKFDKKIDAIMAAAEAAGEGPMLFGDLYRSKCYLDWLLPAVIAGEKISHSELLELWQYGGTRMGREYNIIYRKKAELLSQVNLEYSLNQENIKPAEGKADEQMKEHLRKYTEYRYEYEAYANNPVKLSVSDLKMSAMADEVVQELHKEEREEKEAEVLMPKFLKKIEEKVKLKGSDRGTLYHRMLELHDFTKEVDEDSLAEERTAMIAEGKIPEDCVEAVSLKKLLKFYQSEIGMRMHLAAIKGLLSKEQNFVMSYPASLLSSEYAGEEPVLVQGIVDVFFEEEDGLVLLDYKTDRVSQEDGEQELTRRYKAQLAYYADALGRGTGKKVKERLIYSFALQKCFEV